MFRPSQSLLFKPLPALNKLKIHPPLPLNPRESKQLLNLLTTSFRQQLATEHGGSNPGFKESASQKPIHKDSSSRPRRQSHSDPGPRTADRHMHSVLTNPLFTYPRDGYGFKTIRDPLDVFDQAVALGMMNTQYAGACLGAKKRDIIQSSVLNIREGMRDSRAGLKILKWLISSGTANDNEFLTDDGFAKVFMEYMVAEGLQETVWVWIKRAFQDVPRYSELPDRGEKERALRDIVRPLVLLVKAEAAGPVSLDAAYMCMSRAAGYVTDVPNRRRALGPPGRFLLHETTMLSSKHERAAPQNFESFVGLIPLMSTHPEFDFAYMALLHPSRPSAELALAFLRQKDASQETKEQDRRVHGFVQLGLDTAKFLLEQERYDDSKWVMEHLRYNYPKQLGMEQKSQFEQVKAEASSLLLLDSLSIA